MPSELQRVAQQLLAILDEIPRVVAYLHDRAGKYRESAGWIGNMSLFEEALKRPGIERWPFDLARVQLAYGERLRRARANADSREPLRLAYDAFTLLGARPWADRAAKELRATGWGAPRTTASGEVLTPQEREIADLAASGLSNKQIAERLYLSHRTIGAHLYQIFPKLGITSRAALRDALAALER
ncbi:LuxR C-terminal-related transcriptional regulator [Kribbella sp. NPDC051718]|uniref:helix-turn-helix transcriptional regulator n=1 Tax=Kribbella sp. NPDC051718 TaxID=3155168 RepID=UPI0034478B0D